MSLKDLKSPSMEYALELSKQILKTPLSAASNSGGCTLGHAAVAAGATAGAVAGTEGISPLPMHTPPLLNKVSH